MYNSKIAKYAPYLQQAAVNGILYRPLVVSCYGRVHPECQAILKTIAHGACRRRGVIDCKALLARVHRNIGVEIWRRAASMVHACMPNFRDVGVDFLNGPDPENESQDSLRTILCTG